MCTYSTVSHAVAVGREVPLSYPAAFEVSLGAKRHIDISYFALTFDCEEVFCSNLVCAFLGCRRDVSDRHRVRFGLERTEPCVNLKF